MKLKKRVFKKVHNLRSRDFRNAVVYAELAAGWMSHLYEWRKLKRRFPNDYKLQNNCNHGMNGALNGAHRCQDVVLSAFFRCWRNETHDNFLNPNIDAKRCEFVMDKIAADHDTEDMDAEQIFELAIKY